MALQITITDAGRSEIINAANTGTAPVEITEVGLGTGNYVPDPTQTALQIETKRLTTIAGLSVAADTIHLTIKDESADVYDVSEFGLYTASGTLFAVYSDTTNSFMQKAAGNTLLLSVDIVLGTLDATNITFGDTAFANPPASESVSGIAKLATTAEAQAGSDDLRIMTPKKTHEALGRFGVAGDVANYLSLTSMERQVAAASGGNLRLIYDDLDNPSYMYRVPKINLEDIGLPGTGVHPAFIVDGVEVPEFWVGAYQATVINGRGCSLPGVDPTTSIDFDAALAACNSKGAGWHLASNAEWSAIQGICRSMGHIPRGNTNYGRAYDATFEAGRRVDNLAPGTASVTGRTYTGSGPASWNHNGQEFGIADLVGNVWEWQSGLRLVDGEIQIIPDNDAAAQADNTDTSTAWKAILQDGSLVAPGTAGTLKLDGTSATNATAAQINTVLTNIKGDTNYNYTNFESLAAASGVTVPDILKVIGIAPYTTHDADKLWSPNAGERLP
ncbi:MAG: SUMF1/EgtB/PvdO family nonheme iron enzyme, partial [Thiotrichales bacterium]|nr:SUMF1/EgtB/PvdO family nonheme iron enzyme [Thiotrichales bacterium]